VCWFDRHVGDRRFQRRPEFDGDGPADGRDRALHAAKNRESAAGSSSMRLTASALAQTGAKVITIVATSDAGAVQTTTVTVTVH